MTTGEGGAVASIHTELLEKAKRFSRQGLVRSPNEFKITDQGPWHQEVHEFGLNYRLPDLLCALGISQLRRLEDFKTTRSRIFHDYSEAFEGHEELKMPRKKPYVDPNWHLFPLRVDPTKRFKIYENLRENGIGVQVNYLPAFLHPVFSAMNYDRSQFPMSNDFYDSEISLPMHTGLTSNELEIIIAKVIRAIEVSNSTK